MARCTPGMQVLRYQHMTGQSHPFYHAPTRRYIVPNREPQCTLLFTLRSYYDDDSDNCTLTLESMIALGIVWHYRRFATEKTVFGCETLATEVGEHILHFIPPIQSTSGSPD